VRNLAQTPSWQLLHRWILIVRHTPIRSRSRRRHLGRLTLVAAVAGLLAGCAALSAPQRELAFEGPEDGTLLNAAALESLVFSVEASIDDPEADVDVSDLALLLDGTDVTGDAEVDTSSLRWTPGTLTDGERTVTVVSRPVPAEGEDEAGEEPADPEELHTWTFVVDATPPEIALTSPDGALVAGEPVVIAGTTEPGASVQVGDQETTAGEDGSFSVELAAAPEGALALIATDAAGNSTGDEASFVVVPSRVELDELRSVHVSFCGWASPSLKEPVLRAVEEGRINAVQLDLKDETGKIGHATEVELAARAGADQPDCRIDLPAAVAELHGMGVPVVGRIVAFADPVLAPWAWNNGERDMVIQTADGQSMYTGRYAGFANFANDEVVDYLLDIAEEAAAMGVDHILWDYIRKPDGSVEKFNFPGLEGTPEDRIAEFTRLADERLAPYGVQHGASVYGVSADRPWEVSQDIEQMADHLDYVAPMIYPSHWGPGEYGVANPLMQPGDMVRETLKVWLEVTDGKRARVKPWLEDSNWPVRLGFPDRARYVREQIEATYEVGLREWLLWDSAVKYTDAAMIQPPAA
jgi:hypothetical protein